MTSRALGPFFADTLWLLLRAARLRAVGRVRRRSKLGRLRGGRSSAYFSFGLLALGLVIGVIANGACAVGILLSVGAAEQVQAETGGRVVVDAWFVANIAKDEAALAKSPRLLGQITALEDKLVDIEAERLAKSRHGDARAIAATLRQAVHERPTR